MAVLIRADSRYPVNRKSLREAVIKVLSGSGIDWKTCEVSVAVVGERKMRDISTKYYKDSEKHQILTFPFEDPTSNVPFVESPDGILRLGEIILCWPQVVREAGRHGVMVDHEMRMLAKHGVEHLLGKHHGD